jgi:hypothetical protein
MTLEPVDRSPEEINETAPDRLRTRGNQLPNSVNRANESLSV